LIARGLADVAEAGVLVAVGVGCSRRTSGFTPASLKANCIAAASARLPSSNGAVIVVGVAGHAVADEFGVRFVRRGPSRVPVLRG